MLTSSPMLDHPSIVDARGVWASMALQSASANRSRVPYSSAADGFANCRTATQRSAGSTTLGALTELVVSSGDRASDACRSATDSKDATETVPRLKPLFQQSVFNCGLYYRR